MKTTITTALTFAVAATMIATTFPAMAAITNLAPGGTESASGFIAGGEPDHGNDGNTNGSFGAGSVFHSTFVAPAFWEVDLGADALIDSINFFRRTDANLAVNAKIEVFASTDLITPVYTSPDFLQNTSPSFTSLNVTGQLVRVTGSTNFIQFAELEVFGEFPLPPTPEPSTFVLAALGVVGLAARRRRQR